jgi:hypothetical protein
VNTNQMQTFRRAVYDGSVLAADSATITDAIAVKDAYHQIFITKITVSVTTDAAQSLTFQDDAGTPIVIAKTKATPGLGPIVFEFGDLGTPLTVGKNLDITISGAGLAARVHVEGYQRKTGVDYA